METDNLVVKHATVHADAQILEHVTMIKVWLGIMEVVNILPANAVTIITTVLILAETEETPLALPSALAHFLLIVPDLAIAPV